jgi:hypothetical protein
MFKNLTNSVAKIIIVTLLIILLIVTIGGISGIFFVLDQEKKATAKNQEKMLSLTKEVQISVSNQRRQKNEIADIFDNQAALNDDLQDQQRKLISASEQYIFFIDSTVRFVDGQPQFLPGMKEKNLLEIKNNLASQISDLKKLGDENAQKKEQNSTRIKQIYLDSKEDRNNTANEREGLR